MRRSKLSWVTAAVIVALVVVVGPALVPSADPEVTSTVGSPAPVTTPATQASTTTTTLGEVTRAKPQFRWTRIDPETLEDVVSVPLALGDPGSAVFSPDGMTLASFVYEGSDNSQSLVIANLEQWQAGEPIPLEGWVANDASGVVEGPVQAAFLGEGDVLTWVAQLPTDYGSGPVAEDYALFHFALDEERPEVVYRFPLDFAPWEMRLLPGDRIAVFGSPVVFDDEAPDDVHWPRLILIDGRTGRLLRDVPIPELVAGHEWREEGVGSFMHPGLGWDIARERLHIVHADRLAVTVLDLVRGELVDEAEIRLPTSLRQRLMLWLLPPAQAKLQEGTRRNVRIDPEGARLYISGVRWDLVRNDRGEAVDEQQVALGVTVLDTSTLETVAHLDLPVSDVEISPDGRLVLAAGVADGRVVDGDPEMAGLYVLDADTLEERGHLWLGTIPWLHSFSEDGRSVFVTVWEGKASLIKLDPFELEVLAERALANTEQASFELAWRGLTATWVGK